MENEKKCCSPNNECFKQKDLMSFFNKNTEKKLLIYLNNGFRFQCKFLEILDNTCINVLNTITNKEQLVFLNAISTISTSNILEDSEKPK